ncbi:histidine kinase [Xenophilus sp. AP218F]|nr:type IV pili methyl-accepting chemotaxis transducer N-terminal domain-containing protein [Chromobacterium sp. ASV5]OWY37262.1 histidine kinase [Xenophilus sp. AP218F]
MRSSSPLLAGPLGLRLSAKIVGVLLAFLLIALGSIGSTLWLSWQQEGGAAAINVAGSLRMRVTQMALDAQRYRLGLANGDDIRQDMADYQATLALLRAGDPQRPLLVPQQRRIRDDLDGVGQAWDRQLRPLLEQVLGQRGENAAAAAERFALAAHAHVRRIDGFVRHMEIYNARNTDYLRLLQLLLAAMAVAGTVALIYLMTLLVLRPLDKLHQGMRTLAEGDYAARVPVETDDEFGQVSQGFNHMAERLAEAHATLEERVRDKTASLREKNQELALLYEISSFLNQSLPLETLCQGFLQRVRRAFDADGGAVRFNDQGQGMVFVVADAGLPDALLKAENCLPLGECLCGEVAQSGDGRSELLADDAGRPCRQEGFRAVSAFPVATQNRTLGLFNLHFREARVLLPQQSRLLEALGRHLAVAVENQRLVAKARELAVLEERNLVAQGLHDSIAQGLSFLNLQTQMMRDALEAGDQTLAQETLARFEAGVKESYDDVRELLNNFRSRLAEDLGHAVAAVLDKFRRQTGIQTELRIKGASAPLMAEQQLQMLFILQEALSNVRKHAAARHVLVQLSDDGEVLTLSVLDNGVGFELSEVEARGDSHYGLAIMRERAARAGLQLTIEPTPGQGTLVGLLLPRERRMAA